MSSARSETRWLLPAAIVCNTGFLSHHFPAVKYITMAWVAGLGSTELSGPEVLHPPSAYSSPMPPQTTAASPRRGVGRGVTGSQASRKGL